MKSRSSDTRPVTAGWTRTKLPVTSEMLVVDIGSGAHPNPRADVLVDRDLTDNRHRAGHSLVLDGRPLVCADVNALPFRDGAVDFAIISHLAEHVDDPAAMCAEVSRAAVAGYIETPSPLCDKLLHEDYHIWRVDNRDGVLAFEAKDESSRVWPAFTDRFYKLYNSARPQSERPTFTLPSGPVGRALRFVITGVGFVMNKTGLMHTKVMFSLNRPLRWGVSGRVQTS